jgi:hypothetical protein
MWSPRTRPHDAQFENLIPTYGGKIRVTGQALDETPDALFIQRQYN